jgi:hypothetical protein
MNELIQKIISRKEYSQLPMKDVELAFEKFDKEKYSDEEKIKLTRKLLRDVFSSFTSQKLLLKKSKDFEWVLKKHISTRERLPYYKEVYRRILKDSNGNLSVIDLGAGVNGFSYEYFGKKIDYIAIEAIGQLVDLMNEYFKRQKFNAKAIHMSLLESEKIKEIIKKQKKPRVIFLFKTIDSLEMLEKNYSKKLLLKIVPLADKTIVSFAVKSMGKRERFRANRKWMIDFVKDNFKIIDDFEVGGERYIIFSK